SVARHVLASRIGFEHADSLLRRARGIDHSAVEPPGDPKSVSRETTLVDDLADLDELKSMLRVLSDEVAWTLRHDGFVRAACTLSCGYSLPGACGRPKAQGLAGSSRANAPCPNRPIQARRYIGWRAGCSTARRRARAWELR